jgi:cytochrome b561
MTGNTKSSWGTLSRSFHWILGLAIIGMIAYGWWMNHFPARADRYFYRSIHADIGYLVLLSTVVRLIWRSAHPTPDLPSDTPRWLAIARAHQSLGALSCHHPGRDAGLGNVRSPSA